MFCVHGKWRKAAGIPDSSTHVRVLEKKERVAGTWNQTAGASLLGFGQTLGIAAVPSPICPSGGAPKGYGSGAREETGGDVHRESGGIIFTAAFKKGSI